MADYGDQSQALSDTHLRAALSNIEHYPQAIVENIYCVCCGEEIPENRRKALPGCTLCIECKQLSENSVD